MVQNVWYLYGLPNHLIRPFENHTKQAIISLQGMAKFLADIYISFNQYCEMLQIMLNVTVLFKQLFREFDLAEWVCICMGADCCGVISGIAVLACVPYCSSRKENNHRRLSFKKNKICFLCGVGGGGGVRVLPVPVEKAREPSAR